jgi:hypothetical protein
MTLKNLKIPNSFLRNTQILDNQNLSYNNEIDKRVMIKIKMKRLPDDTALKPNYKGMIFLYFAEIRVQDISKKFINDDKEYVSVKGKETNIRTPDKKTVNQIKTCITDNPKSWNPKNFEPPCISEWGECLLGRHRVDGHEEAGERKIIVAVVRFKKERNKSPLYWLRCAQGMENNTPIIKNQGTDHDTIKNTLNQISEKSIKATKEDIFNSLKDQGIKHALKRRRLLKLILKKLKVKNLPETPHIYTQKRKKEEINKKYPNMKTSTLSVYDLFKKPKNININDNGDIIFTGAFTDKPDRYPIVNPFNTFALGADYPHSQLNFIYQVNTDDAKQVKKIRQRVPKIFKNFKTKILQIADHIRSKNFKEPKLTYLPQLKEDEK